MSDKIIEVKNLIKSFGDFQAVKDVSFTVYKGDVFGFLGPNGAGKSTTIRCMLSLIKPDSGQISLFGKSLASSRSEILSRTGIIIEKPDFYKYLSAYRNLELFSGISGKPSSKKEIYEMLDFVGLSGREKDNVGGFSHGMKQRLGIAQTLLHNPDLIILDEPTTGLDPQGIIDIRNLILKLRNEQHKTVLLSSHILSEIEIISNRMVIINKGKSVVEGAVSELLNSEELIVNFELDDLEAGIKLVANDFPLSNLIKIDDAHFQVSITKQQISKINELLLANGINVYSIESKRKLEDYFIKIINS
jgi:ABC-type multidrug transport system ATPase subunit